MSCTTGSEYLRPRCTLKKPPVLDGIYAQVVCYNVRAQSYEKALCRYMTIGSSSRTQFFFFFFGRHCDSKGRGRKCKGTFHQFQEILCECASRWREKNRYVVVCDDIDSASPDVKTVDVLCHT